jgi:hypothetical protein
MEFVHGLNLDINSVNKILQIAKNKGYLINEESITTCNSFKFDEINQVFEFYLKTKTNIISLDRDKFIECYTRFLKN